MQHQPGKGFSSWVKDYSILIACPEWGKNISGWFSNLNLFIPNYQEVCSYFSLDVMPIHHHFFIIVLNLSIIFHLYIIFLADMVWYVSNSIHIISAMLLVSQISLVLACFFKKCYFLISWTRNSPINDSTHEIIFKFRNNQETKKKSRGPPSTHYTGNLVLDVWL